MPPSPFKRRLITAIRWSLLVDAGVSAAAALLTVFPWPVWTEAMGRAWPVGMVVPEIALWLVPLPVGFAAAAVLLGRRSRRWLTGTTVVLCAAAVMLLCKPAVQAWRLGQTLDARLDAAFGAPPVPPPGRPFSIDYRLSPQFQWPAQRDDLLAAIRFLRAHAADLDIDGGRLVLLGRSAGGQMATAAAYAEVIPGGCGIVDIYGPTDFDLTWEAATRPRSLDHRYNLELFLGGTPETARAAYQSASSATLVTRRAPPTLILQGELDINVFTEQAERLDRKLAEAGVPHALVSLPWAGHAFDLVHFNTPGAQIGRYAIVRFLASVTR